MEYLVGLESQCVGAIHCRANNVKMKINAYFCKLNKIEYGTKVLIAIVCGPNTHDRHI